MVRSLTSLALTGCIVGGIGCGRVDAVTDAPAPSDVNAADAADDAMLDAAADAAIDTPVDAAGSDGLVARYKMDTLTNRMVEDALGRHPGLCINDGCPQVTTNGKIVGAYVFDGVDDIIRVESARELETGTAFTVTAWINLNAAAPPACIINKLFGTVNENSWQACTSRDGRLLFHSFGQGVADSLGATMQLLAQRWYHIALWWNGSTKRIYIDGSRVASKDGVIIEFDDATISLGADLDEGVLLAPLAGQIDDVRIYDRALSETEIIALQSP